MAGYSADSPLRATTEDRFQRWPFARRVARVIATRIDPESIVIGVNGAWGEGKTTVLNFIEEELNNHQNVVCFRFNPWRFPDETKLIRDFFQSLAGAVDKKLEKHQEKFGTLIGKYLAGPASLLGAGEAVKAVGELLSSVDLEELKSRVEAGLVQSGKRVVVLMDDIDRLDKNEIQMVFRLVKLVADFRCTAYILAFDAEMVASALQERYSNRDAEAGQNFLEKIIQVPLDLPQIPSATLREYCFQILEGVFQSGGIGLTEEEVAKFVRGFDTGLAIRMKTPRMAKRYGNILSFALPILEGEVNPVDLMLIEGIRIFYPLLYDFIRENIDCVIPTGNNWGRDNTAREQKTKQRIDSALEGLSGEDNKAAIGLLTQLFPKLEGVYGGSHYDDSFADRWGRERLVTSRAYFQRYFSYAIPDGQVSDRELSQFITSLPSKSDDDNAAELKRLIGSKNAPYVVPKLRAVAETVEAETARRLVASILTNGASFPRPKQLFMHLGPFSQAGILIGDLISRVTTLAGNAEGRQLAIKAISHATPLTFAVEVMGWIGFESEEGDPEDEQELNSKTAPKRLPNEDRQTIGRVLGTRIKESLAESGFQSAINAKEMIRYWEAWAIFGSRDETVKFVSSLLDAHPENCLPILEALLPTSWSMSTGLPGHHRGFERGEYDNLIRFADPEHFFQSIDKLFGPYQQSERFPRDYGESDPAQALADQFRWMHRFVVAESKRAAETGSADVESPLEENESGEDVKLPEDANE